MLLKLSLVTETLVGLIKQAVIHSPDWPPASVLTVSPDPPDRLSGDRTLGLYLYHAQEDPARRNAPPPDDSSLPARHSPLPLLLHYLLTAHSDLPPGTRTYEEQHMMGLAMKALHDHSRIDDDTRVGNDQVMPATLRGQGNRLLITSRTVPPTDAVSYWAAGQNPPRLSAYYEVAAVLLAPEKTTSRPARVLSVGTHPVLGTGPHVTGTESEVTFTVPGGPGPRTVRARPAEAAVGDLFTIVGTGLGGDPVQLTLHHAQWPGPVTVDPLAWGVTAGPGGVTATVQPTAGGWTILPGVYAVTVSVQSGAGGPAATPGPVLVSNSSPFTVVPAVRSVSTPTAERRVTVEGGSFDPVSLPKDEIQVYVGTARLSRRPSGATDAGEFCVLDGTHLEVRLPDGPQTGDQLPLRVIVRGAESAPRWVTVP
ncbi:DUF4255 domain-containing protein [Streptomyces sp. NPDC059874]|uniref:DUF4255 domain-containing protein n=1 Tax=Streptomyces sp. NPDC059874 TaxID=3346983 RepID=UPI003646BB92